VVPSDRTRGNGHKVKQRKFRLKMRKNFFPRRVTEHWNRLPGEAVESPSLEIFQTHVAAVLCSLLWVTLLGQGVGLGDPQRALPTPARLGFCDSVISPTDEPDGDQENPLNLVMGIPPAGIASGKPAESQDLHLGPSSRTFCQFEMS